MLQLLVILANPLDTEIGNGVGSVRRQRKLTVNFQFLTCPSPSTTKLYWTIGYDVNTYTGTFIKILGNGQHDLNPTIETPSSDKQIITLALKDYESWSSNVVATRVCWCCLKMKEVTNRTDNTILKMISLTKNERITAASCQEMSEGKQTSSPNETLFVSNVYMFVAC